MNKNIIIGGLVVTVLVLIFLQYSNLDEKNIFSQTENKITTETQDEKIHSMSHGKVDVFKRRILGEDKYFLKISTGFKSICTWNYLGGNKGFRYVETTKAESDGIHTMPYNDMLYNFSVQCTDDGGLKYDGNFIENVE